MYLANGTVCLSLLGAFPGGWSGFGAAVFLPGGKKYGAGAARCSRGRAGLRRHGRYPPAPGGYRGDAVAVPGLGGTGGMRSLGPSSAAWPTRLR